MNRGIARRVLTVFAWCSVVAAVNLRSDGGSPRACIALAAAATILLLCRLTVTIENARRGKIAWTRLPLALLVTAEGVLHSLGLVRGGGVEAALLGVCEAALLGTAIVVTLRALRVEGGHALLEERITQALARFVPDGLARSVALEVVIVRFAFSRRGAAGTTSDLFGYAGESPWRLFVLGYPLLLVPNEIFVQSLVPPHLRVLHVMAAALDLYGFIWLLGVYRSMVARPHRVHGSTVLLHRGVLGSAVIDADAVETATPFEADGTSRFPGSPLRLDVGGPRCVLITLHRPVRCQRFLGTRMATRIVISADDPYALCEAVRSASSGGTNLGASAPGAPEQAHDFRRSCI
jgi:hypothetical protein